MNLDFMTIAAPAFFRSRWRGDVSLARVFWMDMLVYGTAINIAAVLGALVLFATDAPTASGVAVYFAPLPYNLFLYIAVWRSAGKVDEPNRSAARLIGLVWFLVAVAV